MHLRNAPTALMKQHGYGSGYEYPHDAPGRFVARSNLPDELAGLRLYEPTDSGAEAAIAERLAEWRRKRGRAVGRKISRKRAQASEDQS